MVEKYDFIVGFSTGKVCPVSKFLEEIVKITKFDKFYCGHFHDDMEIDKYRLLYDDIVEI